jgi:hypothetical protein
MPKIILVSFLLFTALGFSSEVFALALNCKFKNDQMNGVDHIELRDEGLIINRQLEIPLEKTRVVCGNFGRQTRFDGSALGYQVILKSCSTEAKLEGHLIDSVNTLAADVLCQPITTP